MKKLIPFLILFFAVSAWAGFVQQKKRIIMTQSVAAGIPSVEDIDTDWTEADPGDDMTANDTTITMTDLSTRDTDSWWYKDFGANYFDGDF